MSAPRKRRRPQAVTLRDIAQEAGVATSTVSAVLAERDYCYVSDEKRKRIVETARRLKYVPNQMSRALRGLPTRTIGMTFPVAGSPIHHALFGRIARLLWKADYSVLSGSWDDGADECKVLQTLLSRGIDGMILGICIDRDKLEATVPENVPCVNLSQGHHTGACDLATDRRCGIRLAVEHLLAHGRRRIGLVSQGYRGNWEKIESFREVMTRRNDDLSPVAEFVMESPGMDFSAVAREAGDRGIDALVCNNDYTAAMVLRTLSAAGLSVPRDVALIGFDNMEVCELTVPTLTTVSQPVDELARKAVQLLFARMDRAACEHVPELVAPELVIRQSCGCTVTESRPTHGMQGTVPSLSGDRTREQAT